MASVVDRPDVFAANSPACERVRDFALAIFLFYILSPGVSSLFYVESDPGQAQVTSNQGFLLNQVVLIGTFFASIIVAFGLRIPLRKVWQCAWPFLPLCLVIISSLFWSDVPDVAARRSFRLLLEFLSIVLLVAAFRDPSRFFSIITRTFALIVLVDIILLAFPSFSFTDIGFRGIHLHKNTAGAFALFSLPFFLFAIGGNISASKKAASVGLLIGTLGILILSRSKTSGTLAIISLTLAGLILLFLCMRNYARGAALSFGMIVVLGAGFIFAQLSITPIDFAGIVWGDVTLTGRDKVWSFTSEAISKSPVFGFGFGSFWETPLTSTKVLFANGITFPFNTSHNGYLDALVQIGWLGMLCVILVAIVVFTKIFTISPWSHSRKQIIVCIYLFLVFWMHNITESSLVRTGSGIWVLFLFSCIGILSFFQEKEGAAMKQRDWG